MWHRRRNVIGTRDFSSKLRITAQLIIFQLPEWLEQVRPHTPNAADTAVSRAARRRDRTG